MSTTLETGDETLDNESSSLAAEFFLTLIESPFLKIGLFCLDGLLEKSILNFSKFIVPSELSLTNSTLPLLVLQLVGPPAARIA